MNTTRRRAGMTRSAMALALEHPDVLITRTLSKAYGMAGHRTGYLVGPPAAVVQALKVSTHTAYAAPTAGQLARLHAVGGEGLAGEVPRHRPQRLHGVVFKNDVAGGVVTKLNMTAIGCLAGTDLALAVVA